MYSSCQTDVIAKSLQGTNRREIEAEASENLRINRKFNSIYQAERNFYRNGYLGKLFSPTHSTPQASSFISNPLDFTTFSPDDVA